MQALLKSNTRLIEILLIIFVLLIHVFKISDIPIGLYTDETSIGYNALLISEKAVDQYGDSMPLYFKAFGEYKNPIYIYTAAALFKVAGVSEFTLRFTSFIFYALLFFSTLLLVKRTFGDNRLINAYTVIALGFLPWFFTLSRISFEVISYVSLVSLLLLLISYTFHSKNNQSYFLYGLTGLVLGLSVYSYSTSRILTFVTALILAVVYLRRSNIRYMAVLYGVFVVSIVPFFAYIHQHPFALTNRFESISIFNPKQFDIGQFIPSFVKNYLQHFDFNFLVFTGDLNQRHAAGFGGQIQLSVFVLCIVGVGYLLSKARHIFKDRLLLFTLLSLLFAPFASALTTESPHALRSATEGLFILLLSVYGLHFLLESKNYLAAYTLIAILIIQSLYYTQFYFSKYPEQSIVAFESHNYKAALEKIAEVNPARLYLLKVPLETHEFYKSIMARKGEVSSSAEIISIPDEKVSSINVAGSCMIYNAKDEHVLNRNNLATDKNTFQYNILKITCFDPMP